MATLSSVAKAVWCVALLFSELLQARCALALPSLRCETIEIVEQDGIGRVLGLTQLVESMKSIPLTIVPNGTPADIRVDFTFSSGSGRIMASVHSWAETEPVYLQSERVPWLEDFQARRRTIQSMPAADAQAFRQQLVAELTKQVEARTAAVAIASEPGDLPVVITIPEHAVAPLNRNRSMALLGCLRDGAELEGYVTWPDGHREPFKRRASQTPGRFVVGSPAPTEQIAAKESPLPTDAIDVATEPAATREKPASFSRWYWWLGGGLIVILSLLARSRGKKQ